MEQFYKLVAHANARFPEGVEPYRILARVQEECGEVAEQVHIFEDSGIKRLKHGEPNKNDLANEVRQAVTALMNLVVYYGAELEFERAVEAAVARAEADGKPRE